MANVQNPWSVPVAVDDIPETGLHFDIEAPAEARAEIVRLAGLRELLALSAAFDLTRRGAGAHLVGRVKARVGQTCVVTLEPIENDIDESIDLVFAPTRSDARKTDSSDRKGGGDDPPEALVGGKLDLGAVATEFLLLGIDPYPRRAGVEFAAIKADDDSTRPFAGLEALKKRLGS
jgi:hypothetical protein